MFKRLLLKLSGEALMGEREFGTDPQRLAAIAAQ
ncbi:MAG: UMP kinase, partial [Solirubrobacterales bacterium]|nr:UMP kinase [Solirubrobacterales bacterium]